MRFRDSITSPPIIAASLSLVLITAVHAQGLTVKTVESPAPEQAAQEFRDTLDAKAVQLSGSDGTVAEFWFRKEIPLTKAPESPGKALDAIADVTFIGVVKVHNEMRDFRDDELIPGVYTMRFAKQPADGNHLGTAPHPWFLILVPAHYDKSLDGIPDAKKLSELSAEDTATEHPNNLSLQPLPQSETSDEFPRTGEGGDNWNFIYLKLPATVQGGDKTELRFGLVYEGHGKL